MTKNTIKKYTQFITSVEKRGTRRLYHIGENFIVEASIILKTKTT